MLHTVLQTERLWLRPLTLDDLDALCALYADAETMRFLGGTRCRGEARDELEQVQRDQLQGWGPRAAVRRRDGQLIGRCGLWLQRVDERPEVEVAYLMARAEWNRGYATEAARALRDAAFALGQQRLVSLIHPANVASQQVALKNGMHHAADTVWQRMPTRVYVVDVA